MLFNFLKKEKGIDNINVSENDIIAMADGEIIDIHNVSDSLFAQEILGKSIAFKYSQNKVILCAPTSGVLSVLFPTGHAFGITRNDGVELLIHIGIDTVNANGNGFKLLSKKQGDKIKMGDPIVEVNIKKLSQNYDMSTMLIITNPCEKEFEFISPQSITKGMPIVK
ncbi:MAG: PTS glucose transporter subunit IIA [Traorella sp.]